MGVRLIAGGKVKLEKCVKNGLSWVRVGATGGRGERNVLYVRFGWNEVMFRNFTWCFLRSSWSACANFMFFFQTISKRGKFK